MNNSDKLENENYINMEFIKAFLLDTKLSSDIIKHSRFDSILWKISSLLLKSGIKAYSRDAINFLNSFVLIQKDGSIVILEKGDVNAPLNSTKYYYDSNDLKLKKILYMVNEDGTFINSVSTYDQDGIEESLLLEQKCIDGSKHYSKSVRVPERIDMIRVESISEINGKKKSLGSTYQIRTFCAAYEDIDPLASDIDPLDKVGLSFLGVPEIYRDLTLDEVKIINECDGEIFPLDDANKEEQFIHYVETNKFYGRTRTFEDAVAEYLSIDNNYLT